MRHLVLVLALAVVVTASPAFAQDAPPADVAKSRATCDAALAKPPGGDPRFVTDVQASARGWIGSEQLAKSPEGTACMEAIRSDDGFRSSMSAIADTAAATERVDATKAEHTAAALAIAKNEKHVVLAYGALWILAAGFLIFLWRRQQGLNREIAQLRRDLDAAAK